jgi:hypothetical protein
LVFRSGRGDGGFRGGFFRGGGRFDVGGEAALLVLVADENGQGKAEDEEQGAEIDGAALEHVGGAGAEYLVGDAGAEGGAETFLFGPLHQDQEGHQQGHEHKNHQQEVDDDREPFNRS